MAATSHQGRGVLSEDRLLSPKEVAEVLGVSRDYVYRLISEKVLPDRKINGLRRIWMSEVRTAVDAALAA